MMISFCLMNRELDDESSDESETETDMDAYTTAIKGKHDLMMKSEVCLVALVHVL